MMSLCSDGVLHVEHVLALHALHCVLHVDEGSLGQDTPNNIHLGEALKSRIYCCLGSTLVSCIDPHYLVIETLPTFWDELFFYYRIASGKYHGKVYL